MTPPIEASVDGLEFLIPDWSAPAAVRAACSTRRGGVSLGPYASLNLGRSSGDLPHAVSKNRRRVAKAIRLPDEPAWIRQVHGTRVVGATPQSPIQDADASFSTRANVICAVQAADCLPVLFCDDSASVVAAAHAGWRGLAAGVLEATIAALPVAPARLMAWLGPAIGPEAFEVGEDVRAAFANFDPTAAVFFVPTTPGKYLADLFGLARLRLRAAGVQRISGGGISTYADPGRFFSYRRDGICGRMAAFIWLDAGA